MTHRQKFRSSVYSVNKSVSRPSPCPTVWGRGDEQGWTRKGYRRREAMVLSTESAHLSTASQLTEMLRTACVCPGCAPTGELYHKKPHRFTTPGEKLCWSPLLHYRQDFFLPMIVLSEWFCSSHLCTTHLCCQEKQEESR